jgi:MFS family permease
MFQSLRIRDFRILWVSIACGAFGMQMLNIARGWLIYDMTQSPMALTWVMLSFMVPTAIFSLVGGVVADRMSKKTIMIYSQLLNAVACFALAYITYVGEVTFWHFIYFGVFNGAVGSVSMPARFAITPEVVGNKNLVNASALQTATYNVSRVIGPVLAGGLIAFLAAGDTSSTQGVGLVFFIISALLLLSALVILFLKHNGTPHSEPDTPPMEDLREGLRFVRDDKLILGLLMMGIVPSAFGASVNMMLPAFNQDVIGGGPDDLGILTAGMGIGALAGSMLLARLGDFRAKGRTMFSACYGWGISVAVFALTGNLYTAMFAGAFTAFFHSFFGSLNMSVAQLVTPQHIHGRVMSLMMLIHGLTPLGVIPVGIVAELAGIKVALMFSAVMLALSVVLLKVLFPQIYDIDRGH